MARRTYYQILGVRRTATDDEIRSAYRERARRYHPDQNPDDPAAEEAFKAVAEAHRVLSDRQSRHAYDAFGVVPAGAAYADLALPKRKGVADLVREVARSAARVVKRGKNIELAIAIPFARAMRGTYRIFELPRLGSDGRVQARRLRFELPPGLDDGKVLRWPGEGEPEPSGGRSGDLYVSVSVSSGGALSRGGPDIRCALPLTVDEAMAGTTIRVPTLFGPELLDVPRGSWVGDQLRLRGRGVPGPVPGDAVFSIELIRPALTHDTIELAKRLYDGAERSEKFRACLRESESWRDDE